MPLEFQIKEQKNCFSWRKCPYKYMDMVLDFLVSNTQLILFVLIYKVIYRVIEELCFKTGKFETTIDRLYVFKYLYVILSILEYQNTLIWIIQIIINQTAL